MCNNNNNNTTEGNCISEILNVILILQQNACSESGLDSCDRPMLGGGPNCLVCNTRPVMLYLCGCCNTPLSMPITKDATDACTEGSTTCSNVFRVEKMDGNCATFRVLTPNPDTTGQPWLPTNSLFTVNLDCCCVIRCLSDSYVECM